MRDRAALIVEDNSVNLRVIEAFLRRVQPKRVFTARNGEEALRILEEEECGIVLMDTHMPVMDGLAATRRIRASDAAWSNIPIIAVSAAATGDEKEACFSAGANAFLAKPISPDDLYEKIVRVCAE
jgi:CheY-like chemotaxis protein